MNLPKFLTQDKYGFIHLVGHRIGLRQGVPEGAGGCPGHLARGAQRLPPQCA